MANVRLKDFPALTGYLNLATGDIIYFGDASASYAEKKVTLSDLAAYVLENRTIADGTAGAIATIDASQTLTNKRLNSPGINSATAITADSAEINVLDGITASTAELNKLAGLLPTTTELNYVDGVTSAIQTQIDNLSAAVGAITSRIFKYGTKFTAADTNATITAATVLATLSGIPGWYLIDPQSVIINTYLKSGGAYKQLDNSSAITTQYTTTTSAGVERVKEFMISGLSISSSYCITIHFGLVADPT